MRTDRPDAPDIRYPTTARGRKVELWLAAIFATLFWLLLVYAQLIGDGPFLGHNRFSSWATVAAFTGPFWIVATLVCYARFLKRREL